MLERAVTFAILLAIFNAWGWPALLGVIVGGVLLEEYLKRVIDRPRFHDRARRPPR